MALKIRRGTSQQRTAITPASGELVFDTSQTKLYVGNGTTLGGVEVVAGAIGGNLGSNINLNNFDITGTGNINVTGAITASGTITANGNIVLGNQDTDNVTFGADINSNIVPNAGNLTLGTQAKPWQTVHVAAIENTSGITINSNLALNGNIVVNTIVPSGNTTKDLGSLAARWKNIYSEEVLAGSVRINGNDISTTESNANINIVPSGTGSVTTNRIAVSSYIDVGGANPVHIEEVIGGGGTNQAIHYFYDDAEGFGNITDRADQVEYTQLVTNAEEIISLGSFDTSRFSGSEFMINVVTSSGSQIIKFIYTFASGVGQLTTTANVSAGTAPVTAALLRIGSQNIIDLKTNTATNAGVVYKLKIKQTIFRIT